MAPGSAVKSKSFQMRNRAANQTIVPINSLLTCDGNFFLFDNISRKENAFNRENRTGMKFTPKSVSWKCFALASPYCFDETGSTNQPSSFLFERCFWTKTSNYSPK